MDKYIQVYGYEVDPDDLESFAPNEPIDEQRLSCDIDDIDRLRGSNKPTDLAFNYLKDQCGLHPSSGEWHVNLWYTRQSGQNLKTGNEEHSTFHLTGFTPDEEKEVYDRLKKGGELC